MIKIHIAVESGTSGYYDTDSCDMEIAELNAEVIPRQHDLIEFRLPVQNNEPCTFMVTNVLHCFDDTQQIIKVYVIPYNTGIFAKL